MHRRKPLVFDVAGLFPAGSKAAVWATCLRSLAFVKSLNDIELDARDEVYERDEAYRFLLEVVCGLHSPILGETEVFGQFKAFAPKWLGVQPEHSGLAQKVLADAKALRSKYLSHLGNQSYGSWLRKNVRTEQVHILGGGQLAREILPYLTKQGKSVSLHVRNPQKIDFHEANAIHTIKSQNFAEGALIIAAPLTAQEINEWLGERLPEQVFDLRDNSCADPINRCGDHHGLNAIFNQIEQNKARLMPVIEEVRAQISSCADKIAAQSLIRPQGWDDLCA